MYQKLSGQPKLKDVVHKVSSHLDAMALLDYYHAENISEIHTPHGLELRHSCLIERVEPHHSHSDSSASASLRVDNLNYGCWSWGGGGFFWLLKTLEQDDEIRIRRVLHDLSAGLYRESPEKFMETVQRVFSKSSDRTVIENNSYHEKVLEPWLQIRHPYFSEDRGISEDVIDRMKLGYDDKEIRVVIPHFFDHKLVGWQKRALDNPEYPISVKSFPKYKSSIAFPRKDTLFNYDNLDASKPLFVVEAPMSVLRGLTHGNDLDNITATFGASVTKEQMKLMQEFPLIYIGMDPDPAGWVASLKLMKELGQYTEVRMLSFPQGKDYADMQLSGQADTPNLYEVIASAEKSWQAIPRLEKMMTKKRNRNVKVR